ncbi:putative peptidyl-tRNA hydrolase PTRHD1 [Mobula birostris]|uniref:putative peptidyl-tRNA hydrolase PTRHD1 n=1 Tax=Mobula birostris TaxID=1983395 RepID=UPI003B281B56
MAAAGDLVQYVVVRSDLRALGWTLGALVTQACHGSVAAIQLSRDDPDTQAYLQQLDSMATVVLEAPDEGTLTRLSQTLTEAAVVHKLWIEQPENTATCLALKPYPKEQVQKLLKKLKLLK